MGHPGAPTAAHLFAGGEQGTRDCKGIKILLAICSSNHRSEDFLPQPEVFWTLRLSRLSFLPLLVFAVPDSSTLGSLSLPCAGFSSRSASIMGAFAKLDFCAVWPLPCGSRAEVITARSNLSRSTMCVGEVCNFLGSLSLQQKSEATGGPVLQLRDIPQVYLANKGKYTL